MISMPIKIDPRLVRRADGQEQNENRDPDDLQQGNMDSHHKDKDHGGQHDQITVAVLIGLSKDRQF